MAQSVKQYVVWVVLLMLIAMSEATPPGIANHPSNARCVIKKYKYCYNLEHVCPKFCPNGCTVECVSCKPMCIDGSITPPPPDSESPTPSVPTPPPPSSPPPLPPSSPPPPPPTTPTLPPPTTTPPPSLSSPPPPNSPTTTTPPPPTSSSPLPSPSPPPPTPSPTPSSNPPTPPTSTPPPSTPSTPPPSTSSSPPLPPSSPSPPPPTTTQSSPSPPLSPPSSHPPTPLTSPIPPSSTPTPPSSTSPPSPPLSLPPPTSSPTPPLPSWSSPPVSSPPPSNPSTSPKKVKCKNKNYLQCYSMEHVCPNSCPGGCEVDCFTCRPVCKCDMPGAVCQDPRFIGGDGITFYFHGKKDRDFCLVSDSNLHINAHFIGKRNQNMKRDFTWVQSIAILFNNHKLFIGAQKTATWDDNADRLAVAFDGQPVLLAEAEGVKWQYEAEPSVSITRISDTNSVIVEVEGNFKITAKVVPITEEESQVHNYGVTKDDSFAHLDLGFKFFSLSDEVNGVLGQTYRSGYVSRVKMGVSCGSGLDGQGGVVCKR